MYVTIIKGHLIQPSFSSIRPLVGFPVTDIYDLLET